MTAWERARQPEQISEREQAIVNAATTLFRTREYDSISLNGIAREAGFAKSNIYRYFSSREEMPSVILSTHYYLTPGST